MFSNFLLHDSQTLHYKHWFSHGGALQKGISAYPSFQYFVVHDIPRCRPSRWQPVPTSISYNRCQHGVYPQGGVERSTKQQPDNICKTAQWHCCATVHHSCTKGGITHSGVCTAHRTRVRHPRKAATAKNARRCGREMRHTEQLACLEHVLIQDRRRQPASHVPRRTPSPAE